MLKSILSSTYYVLIVSVAVWMIGYAIIQIAFPVSPEEQRINAHLECLKFNIDYGTQTMQHMCKY